MVRFIGNHSGKVYDVAWNHEARPNVFASVGNDRTIVVHDLRDRWDEINFSNPEAGHTADINSVSFNKFSDHLLITGSEDKTICLWDMRNLSCNVSSFDGGHLDEIYQVCVEWFVF